MEDVFNMVQMSKIAASVGGVSHIHASTRGREDLLHKDVQRSSPNSSRKHSQTLSLSSPPMFLHTFPSHQCTCMRRKILIGRSAFLQQVSDVRPACT